MGSVPFYTGFAWTSPTLSWIFSDSVITTSDFLSAANTTRVDATLHKHFTYVYYFTTLKPVGNITEDFMRIFTFPVFVVPNLTLF